jgi:hypothetical protein
MKKEFRKRNIYPAPAESFGFSLEPIEGIKDNALIILDANVLLLPFTTNIKNVEAIKAVYEKLVQSDKIFLPAQTVREYLDNRAKKLTDINEALQKKSNQSFNYVGAHPLLESLDEFKSVLELENELKKSIKDYQNKIRETLTAIQKWGWNDPVSKMYHEVLVGRVLNDEGLDIEEISKDLENRNTLKIPPGYKDQSKEQNQAGDLLIWHEILNVAKEKEQHVIFVSGDEKVDWWHQSGKNPLYPRFELVDEFREKTSGKSFHIVSLSKLLELFETDSTVVNSIKTSEEEAKLRDLEIIKRRKLEKNDLLQELEQSKHSMREHAEERHMLKRRMHDLEMIRIDMRDQNEHLLNEGMHNPEYEAIMKRKTALSEEFSQVKNSFESSSMKHDDMRRQVIELEKEVAHRMGDL